MIHEPRVSDMTDRPPSDLAGLLITLRQGTEHEVFNAGIDAADELERLAARLEVLRDALEPESVERYLRGLTWTNEGRDSGLTPRAAAEGNVRGFASFVCRGDDAVAQPVIRTSVSSDVVDSPNEGDWIIEAEERLLAHFSMPVDYDEMGFTRELRAIVGERVAAAEERAARLQAELDALRGEEHDARFGSMAHWLRLKDDSRVIAWTNDDGSLRDYGCLPGFGGKLEIASTLRAGLAAAEAQRDRLAGLLREVAQQFHLEYDAADGDFLAVRVCAALSATDGGAAALRVPSSEAPTPTEPRSVMAKIVFEGRGKPRRIPDEPSGPTPTEGADG
jgi:hypothetical protein